MSIGRRKKPRRNQTVGPKNEQMFRGAAILEEAGFTKATDILEEIDVDPNIPLIGATITVEKIDGDGRKYDEVTIPNSVPNEGKENILRQLAQLSSGDFPIPFDSNARMRVENAGSSQILNYTTPNSGPSYSGTFSAQFSWTISPGVGTGDWDTVEIYAANAGNTVRKQMSLFDSGLGTKNAPDTWIVNYTFRVAP